jgi:surface antigen
MIARRLTTAILALHLAGCAGVGAGDPALYQGLAESDVEMASRLVQTTLETAPDGATRRWTNQQTGSAGAITPLRTYASEGGYVCREYREELAVAGQAGRFYHTACRDDAARWAWL